MSPPQDSGPAGLAGPALPPRAQRARAAQQLRREHLDRFYEGRERLARQCAAQRFFFDLDRSSNDEYLKRAVRRGELSAEERQQRLAVVRRAGAHLAMRLRHRFEHDTPPPRPGLPFADDVRACSRLFREAAAALIVGHAEPDWPVVGEACVRFGSRQLRTQVLVDTAPPMTWPATEPDSANVLMFAELAFAALDLEESGPAGPDAGMWLALLPDLVKMQWCYWACFTQRIPRHFTSYGHAPRDLPAAERVAIDRAFAGVTDRRALEARVREKLRAHADRFQ